MSNKIKYTIGDALPDTPVTWKENGALQDFTVGGWTLKLRVGDLGQAAAFEKVSGFVTSASDPNVIIQWSTADLGSLPVGRYTCQLRATQSTGSKPMTLKFQLEVEAEVLAP